MKIEIFNLMKRPPDGGRMRGTMISIDGFSSLADTGKHAVAANSASSLQGSLKNLSSESTEEELKQVCKDFESYFVEEILKEVKESMLSEEEERENSLSTLTDYHMDSVIEKIADQVVDEAGASFTQQLYEQMKRNYGIGS